MFHHSWKDHIQPDFPLKSKITLDPLNIAIKMCTLP